MLGLQSLKRAPVHALWLGAIAMQDARLPPEPFPQLVGLPRRAIVRVFALAPIGQAVAVPASRGLADVENRHAPGAAWAAPPCSRAAVGAGRAIQRHGAMHVLPVPAACPVPIGERDVMRLHGQIDAGLHIAVARPLPAIGHARLQIALALQAPHVNLPHVVGAVLSAPSPAEIPTHRRPPYLLAITR